MNLLTVILILLVTAEHLFEKVLKRTGYTIENRIAWFINPHYEVKFGLKPRKLYKIIDKLPYIRDFFTTSSFFVLKK